VARAAKIINNPRPPSGEICMSVVDPVGERAGRWFFLVMFAIAALIVFVGFAPTFYLGPLFAAPALSTLLVVHGIASSAWIALLLTQTLLIRSARISTHRTLGVVGALLAAAMVALGASVAVQGAAQGTLGARFHEPPLEFLIIPLGQILIFGALVAAAIALRRRPAAHKRLMVIATINLIAPAAVRAADNLFHIATPASALAVVIAGVAACIVYDIRTRGRVHPVSGIIGPLTLLSFPLRLAFSHTEAWQSAAAWLVRLAVPGA
jgi:hypothetical protein